MDGRDRSLEIIRVLSADQTGGQVMKFAVEQLNPHYCKTYLVRGEGSEVVLIDPVLDHLRDYLDFLESRGHVLRYVIDTHTHADHISCGPSLKDVTGCEYVMFRDAPAKCVSRRVEGRASEELLEGVPFQFIHTPGHTRDSLSIVCGGFIFTGDVLFLDDGGAGRDDLPGGDPGAHWESLQVLRGLNGSLVVYPAHEYRGRSPTTLEAQKKNNPHFGPATKEDFIQYSEELKLGPAEWMKDVLKANYTCARDPEAAWIPVDQPACEVKGTLEPGVNELDVVLLQPEELRQAMDDGADMLLLDVRDPEELRGPLGQIDGVVNVPIVDLVRSIPELREHQDRDIAVICKSGGRAFTAAQLLTKAGFTRVRVLVDGMLGWNGM